MSAENKPIVSVIVLNYNGMGFLTECFDSLRKTTYPNIELMLVDNNSTDNSVQYVSEKYPEVKIVQIGSNAGYSRAYNISFNNASGKYFVLLNNDVKVENDWIEPLVEAAENDENIGSLQPKIVSLIDIGYFEYAGAAGGYMDKYGFPFTRGRVFSTIEKDNGQYDHEAELFWTSGAAMFLRAEALKKSGNLDDDFFLHMEEIDLCWRLHLAGYKLKCIPASKISHYNGATLKPDSFKKMYLNHRNSIFMMIKNFELTNLLKILPLRFALDIAAMVLSALKFEWKRFAAVIKAYTWLIAHFKMIMRKRNETQKMRVVSDDKIFLKLYPKSIAVQYFMHKKRTFNELMDLCS